MAGSFGSRIVIFALAAAATAVCAVTNVVVRCWTHAVRWADLSIAWIVSRLPKARPDWLRAWHRAPMLRDAGPVNRVEKRRPLVSPRWRMCPSI
jgi:hypothetical protein